MNNLPTSYATDTSDTSDTWLYARCKDPKCIKSLGMATQDRERRATWVGEHRLKTGHQIHQYEGPWEERPR